MRHLFAALTVVVVSILLALSWATPAVAKRTPDPGAAIAARAKKAGTRALKPRVRAIRGIARDAARQLRSLAKAVKKGQVPPQPAAFAKNSPEYTPEDVRAFTNRADTILGRFERELRAAAEDARSSLLGLREVDEVLSSNLTRSERLPGSGGVCDQMTDSIQSACDEGCAEVDAALTIFCQEFAAQGIDVTGSVCPLGKIAPLVVSLDEDESLFGTGILSVLGYGGALEGFVQLSGAPDDNASAPEMHCYNAAGELVETSPLSFVEVPDLATFSFTDLPGGVYSVQLGKPCPEDFLVIDELHCGVGAKPSSGGTGKLFGFSESSASATKDGAAWDPIEVDGATVFNTQNGLTRIELRLLQAGTTDPAVTVVIEIPDGLDDFPASRFVNFGDEADDGLPTHQITVVFVAADGTRYVQPEGRSLQTKVSIAAFSDITIGFLSPPKMVFGITSELVPEETPEAPELLFYVTANLVEDDVDKP